MEIGRLHRLERRAEGARLTIACEKVLAGTRIGDSIAINGVDITVTDLSDGSFSGDVSLETLSRSTLGQLRVGGRVNLERALGVGERLGGHMVQGHVDGTGELLWVKPEGNAYRLRFRFPRELGRYIAMKGSIAVDGISLTVAELGDHWFEVAVIPHTWRETTLGELQRGSPINLEVDVLAKYVERLLQKGEPNQASRLTLDYLIERGY